MLERFRHGAAELRLIIDTDPGVDDAVAILLALAASQVEVVGLTTVGGNVPRARATRNALALLQAAGRDDIPVAAGAARPRTGRYTPSVAFHGPGGLSVRLPDPSRSPVSETAVDFLSREISSSPGSVIVVALGPLTNLSRLQDRHPGVLGEAERVFVMGGAVETRGNVTPRAEFNFHSDPLAAAHVLGSGLPIQLADLAACRQVGISREIAESLTAETALGKLALRVLQGWFRRDRGRRRFEFYDPLAVAMALDPGLATVHNLALAVGTERGDGRGETVVLPEPGSVAVADQVDVGRFFALLEEVIGWRGF